MSVFLLTGLIVLGVIVLLFLWAIASYNGLVRLKALVEEAWSGMDVQLKRRYDLIPNLVATVKQYSIHEKEIFENITRFRSQSMAAGTIEDKALAEKGLTATLKTLFAVAENYPNLKANDNFMHMQKELTVLEQEIQLARRYYNGAARNYNIAVSSFPSSILASLFNFSRVDYFEIGSQERENPGVRF